MDREAEALRGRTWVTRSAAETEALGAAVGRALTGGAVLALFGGLGMGKTAFVRGLAAGRGLEAEVSSPTFALVHEYGGQPPLVHFDMYRVTGWDDLYSTGFFDYIASWRWNGAKTWRGRCPRKRCVFGLPAGRTAHGKSRANRGTGVPLKRGRASFQSKK